ncbi:MAG: DivIVA protein [Actinomycetia bacterium]|nr:DivIVA protein [Actinomycetes bacterium]
MRVMEITARELRDVEIREAFRGYHRDDVNDLLERAATTIDAANERVRQMSERLGTAQVDSGRSRETEDILHRTLLLAQRAADEAVAEAQVKARQMIDDADTKARRTVAEAEAEARHRGESERRRIEQEVLDLAGRRDMLSADVEILTRYEGEYRERLLRSLESDLDSLRARSAVAPGPRPETHEVDIPVASERVARSDEGGPATREIDIRSIVDDAGPSAPPAPASPSSMPASPPPGAPADMSSPSSPSNGISSPTATVATAPEMAEHTNGNASASTNGNGTATSIATEEPKAAPAAIDLLAAEGASDAEVLDDEAFFATLREAVHDEGMPGPRDEEQPSSLFDQDDDEEAASFKDVFRRRR